MANTVYLGTEGVEAITPLLDTGTGNITINKRGIDNYFGLEH